MVDQAFPELEIALSIADWIPLTSAVASNVQTALLIAPACAKAPRALNARNSAMERLFNVVRVELIGPAKSSRPDESRT